MRPNILRIATWATFVIATGIATVVFAADNPSTTGPVGPPFNEAQTWTACGATGYIHPPTQYHMQLNTDLSTPKYHAGEDWNGACGGATDNGAALYAIASGQVVYLDNVGTISGKGKQLAIRHSFPYAKASNGLQTFDSVFLHLSAMAPGITWSGPGTGTPVTPGKLVAYLGGTGTASPHLHWEVQWDVSLPVSTNPYQQPLAISHALKYRASSLIVDDLRGENTYTITSPGGWFQFAMVGNAPSSTTYVEYNGSRKTLKQAIAANWIPAWGVIFEDGGSWYYYTNPDDNFFESGRAYGLTASVGGAVYHIPVPRNGFQGDRARLDMLHAVEADSRFASVLIETYTAYPNYFFGWDLHAMTFKLTDGRTTSVTQVTNRTNRLFRYTSYYDLDANQWTPWKKVDWNQLY